MRKDIGVIHRRLKLAYPKLKAPVKKMPRGNPWRVLVGAVLSTKTRDEVTSQAVKRLIIQAPNPGRLLRMGEKMVADLIYPVGFYRTKAGLLIRLAGMLIEQWQGRVPKSKKALLSLPGVGPKVANIVLAQGFGVPAIAVDTHVHRIANRLGLVCTERPKQTEIGLSKVLLRRYWLDWNRLMVALGQTVCLPHNPRCGLCPIARFCTKRGVRIDKGRRG
ncbi:MAG: endonuclease III domain-containing protein [bacterium]